MSWIACAVSVSVWRDQCSMSYKINNYLYSLSCRIPTGSKPWGFWIGVTRFCFCCIWSMGDICCPGGWGATELPGMGPAGMAGAWGGAGDGRPLTAGVRSFWALAWFSPPWPADQRLYVLLGKLSVGHIDTETRIARKPPKKLNKRRMLDMYFHIQEHYVKLWKKQQKRSATWNLLLTVFPTSVNKSVFTAIVKLFVSNQY